MKDGYPELIFQGNKYILVTHDGISGVIATEEQLSAYANSFAYLLENGEIIRYHEVIGTRDDITWIDKPDAKE